MQKDAHTRALTRANYGGIGAALFTAALAFCTDLAAKALLFEKPEFMANISLAGGLVRITNHRNFGISFNIPLPLPLTVLITLLVIMTVSVWLWKKRPAFGVLSIGAGLLIGGALANLFDRLTLGYVRDWLLLWQMSAINLADLFVLSGLLMLWSGSSDTKEDKMKERED